MTEDFITANPAKRGAAKGKVVKAKKKPAAKGKAKGKGSSKKA
jgi:hypothetical protein